MWGTTPLDHASRSFFENFDSIFRCSTLLGCGFVTYTHFYGPLGDGSVLIFDPIIRSKNLHRVGLHESHCRFGRVALFNKLIGNVRLCRDAADGFVLCGSAAY